MNTIKLTLLAVLAGTFSSLAGDFKARLITDTDFKIKNAADASAVAAAWIAKHGPRLGMGEVTPVKTVSSPLGTHFHYRQTVDGLPVLGSSLVITIDHDRALHGVYHHLAPITRAKLKPGFAVSAQTAVSTAARGIDTSWISAEPQTQAAWLMRERLLVPVYRVLLPLQGSAGSWEAVIDARDGALISRENRTVYHLAGKPAPGLPKGIAPHAAEPARRAPKAGETVDGSALVFDPDPRTALKRDDLQDDSPANLFNSAYQERTLTGLTRMGDTVYLEGPAVRISDFDAPFTAPGTSENGQWTARRGDSAFPDVMAYYHISRNQGYVQSLGFDQMHNRPIEVDTDGHLGNDYSSYDPARDRLSFGRGCVDDAEDADILLHFYAQALLYDVTDNWGGGDSGAIAQGFGDYWAASYSYSTPNGPDWYPERVFHWDGHGDGAWCWEGRMLNRIEATYDSAITYGADVRLNDDAFQSAELWSTPLFQSMMELVAMGVPREEADRIVLQSLHGLGYGVTMPEAAGAVIQAAETLYPGGPHAEVYRKWFAQAGLYGEIDLVLDPFEPLQFTNAGNNNRPDPGETVRFRLRLINRGSVTARAVNAEISDFFDGWSLDRATVTFDDLGPGEVAFSREEFQVTAPPTVCGYGSTYFLTLSWKEADGAFASDRLERWMQLGRSRFAQRINHLQQAIPDADETGISDTITLRTPSLNSGSFRCFVQLTHSVPDDLVVTLTDPEGRIYQLTEVEHFPLEDGPTAGAPAFRGRLSPYAVYLEGDWTLKVVDRYEGDTGYIDYWTITDSFGMVCDIPEDAPRPYEAHFLFTEESENWTTELAVLNMFGSRGSLRLTAFDEDGNQLAQVDQLIDPLGMLMTTPSKLFPRTSGIAMIHVASTTQIAGMSQHRDPEGKYSVGLNAPTEGAPALKVPHIAEDPNFWTRGRLANVGDVALDVDFVDSKGKPTGLAMGPRASKAVDFRGYFDGGIERGAGFGSFANRTNDFEQLAGIEMFGALDTGSSAAGLTLGNAENTRLIFPHIPNDKASFWSGIMLVNSNEFPVEVTVSAHAEEGSGEVLSRITEATFTMEANNKRVDVLENFFPEQDVTAAEWLFFNASAPIAGYELVGSNVFGGDMAGLQAASITGSEHRFPIFAKPGEEWAGVGMVAPAIWGAWRVYLLYLDEDGYYQKNVELPGTNWAGKRVYQLEEFDRPMSVILSPGNFTIGFSLTGSYDGDRINAHNSAVLYEQEILIDHEQWEKKE